MVHIILLYGLEKKKIEKILLLFSNRLRLRHAWFSRMSFVFYTLITDLDLFSKAYLNIQTNNYDVFICISLKTIQLTLNLVL